MSKRLCVIAVYPMDELRSPTIFVFDSSRSAAQFLREQPLPLDDYDHRIASLDGSGILMFENYCSTYRVQWVHLNDTCFVSG